MKLVALLIIVALIVIGYFVVCSSGVEHFFGGNNVINVSWAAANKADSYNWKICNVPDGSNVCDPNPDNWTTSIQTSATTNAVLNTTTCPGCDFKGKLQFAVQSVGLRGIVSAWTIITLDFQAYLKVIQQRIISSTTNPVPPNSGDTSSIYQIAFTNPIPLGTYERNFAYVTLTRGSAVYHYTKPVLYTPIPNKFDAAYINIDYSSANTNWNTPIPGGALASGDIISVSSLFAQVGVNGPTWPPPNNAGPIYYFGSFQVTSSQISPSSPTDVAWGV